VASWAAVHQFGLLNWFTISSVVHFILALALLDFWTYAWHRLNHQVSWFWRFHQVHHVDDCMDVTTANRFHLGEITLSSVFRIAIIALAGIRFGELVIYETCLQFWVQWQHTNIGLPNTLDRLLSWLVVTPAMHKVHHSPDPAETNSNYASLFAFWDRLCGTFVAFNPGSVVRFGLDSNTAVRARTAAGLLLLPFRPVPPINPALNPPRSPLI
jgi:sterol desaturase/sphingolipid hydroxylase (fatty acid hydroxylase superfamily)